MTSDTTPNLSEPQGPLRDGSDPNRRPLPDQMTHREMEAELGKLPAKVELAEVGGRLYKKEGKTWWLLGSRMS